MTDNAAWIRVDCASPLDHKFDVLASRLSRVTPRDGGCETSRLEAFGLCVSVWCAMGFHATDGDISDVPDAVIERWAGWTGEGGAFASAFREMFAQDGVVQAFTARQAKLADIREQARDRQRKRRAKLRDVTGDVTGDKSDTSPPRDETRRDEEKPPVSPFEEIWAAYPKRAGSNSRAEAERAFDARIADGSLTPEAALDAVRRYAAWCEATGKLGTETVMQGASFFGPLKRGYAESWDIPAPTAGPSRADLLRKQGYFVPGVEDVA